MALDLVKRTAEYLKANPEQRFTAREIAEWMRQKYPKECRAKQARSKAKKHSVKTDEGLIAAIAREVSRASPNLQKQYPNITVTEGRPRNYYFSERKDDEVNFVEDAPTSKAETPALKEHDLYPELPKFLWSEFKLHSKRIDENRSSNTHGPSGNEWLHPDFVGMENLSEDWHDDIKECIRVYPNKRTKLWSFEVKKLIHRSNVRMSFFQAVSNSSWANFGYLVAAEIKDLDTLKELRMLASLHGIGFIRLNVDDPLESEVIIPAKERGDVNWDMVNRLAKENKDFMKYIKAVRKLHNTIGGEIDESDWESKYSAK